MAECLRQRQPVTRGLAACARLMGRAVCPRWPSWRRRLYEGVDLLLPHSNAEARQLMHYFRVPAAKIQVVPTGADPRLAEADPEPFAQRVGCRDFVLYLGQIEPAKNQLGFLWAMRGTDAAGGHPRRRCPRRRVVFVAVSPGGRSAGAVYPRSPPRRPLVGQRLRGLRLRGLGQLVRFVRFRGVGGGDVWPAVDPARGGMCAASISAIRPSM